MGLITSIAEWLDTLEEDDLTFGEFMIRHWLSHRTFHVGSGHCEIATRTQTLDEVAERIYHHQPETSVVKVFTDFDGYDLRRSNGRML